MPSQGVWPLEPLEKPLETKDQEDPVSQEDTHAHMSHSTPVPPQSPTIKSDKQRDADICVSQKNILIFLILGGGVVFFSMSVSALIAFYFANSYRELLARVIAKGNAV